jgi:hypothetical protein
LEVIESEGMDHLASGRWLGENHHLSGVIE